MYPPRDASLRRRLSRRRNRPASRWVTLAGPRAFQRLLAESRQGEQLTADLTARAAFATSNPRVATLGRDGIVHPAGDGSAIITATVDGKTATAEVTVIGFAAPFTWSFRNHVLPVLSRAACNSGACHGALAGKGGLKLSLRGYDPDSDHDVLTRQAHGRRVVAGSPADSLVLLKPTVQVGHGGGEQIRRGASTTL